MKLNQSLLSILLVLVVAVCSTQAATDATTFEASKTATGAGLRGVTTRVTRILKKGKDKKGKKEKKMKKGKKGKSEDSEEEDPMMTECPMDFPSGDHMCMPGLECGFGEETCCGETFPSRACTCTEDGQFICRFTEACRPGPEGLDCGDDEEEDMTCPMTAPDPLRPAPCTSAPGTICSYDEECCGAVQPDFYSCECTDTGMWSCLSRCAGRVCDTIEPPLPPNECPVTSPLAPDGSELCSTDGLQCNYGTVDCCGEILPEAMCTCDRGLFICALPRCAMLPDGTCP